MIVAVIVLYQMKLEDSLTYQTIRAVQRKLSKNQSVQLFVYDNSAVADEACQVDGPTDIYYVHDATNPGLAHAYNAAFAYCQQHQAQWLLLLDQDTEVELSLFESYFEGIVSNKADVFVPLVYQAGKQLSPSKGGSMVSPGNYQGDGVTAINSGTLLNITILEKTQGFSLDFPLDYLDHWLFWQIEQYNFRLSVLEQKIEHDLSVTNLQQVSNERLYSILAAEKRFVYHYQPNKIKEYQRHYRWRYLKYLLQDRRKLTVWHKIRRLEV